MKKLIALLILAAAILSLAACSSGNASDPSADVSSLSETVLSESSEDVPESSAEEGSSEAEISEEISEEVSEEPAPQLPDFIGQFLSDGEVNVNVRADSNGSVRLTGVDRDASYGDVILYTYRTAGKIGGLSEFAIASFVYGADVCEYIPLGFTEAGEAESAAVPADGFLVVAHSSRGDIIEKLRNVVITDSTVFPHGVQPCKDLSFKVKKDGGKIKIDGVVSNGEWKDYRIEEVEPSNTNWAYQKFEKENYYSKATYYSAYDDDYLYLCVVVTSPYHYCPITQETAGSMWQYECIQVKVSTESPDSAYIFEHFDHVTDATAANEGVVRAYGFAVNDEGDTCFYENSNGRQFEGLAKCKRDDGKQTTVYEIAIPWSEYGIKPESGMKLGLTFSINSTNEEDVQKGTWKNITYRNGGGVIGRNDWSKIPVITLG